MERYNINSDLRMRIKEYLSFIWKENSKFKEEETKFISELSLELRKEFLVSVYGRFILQNPLFYTNFSKKFLEALIYKNKMHLTHYTPGDIIFEVNNFIKKKIKYFCEKKGNFLNEEQALFFIEKGEVEIIHRVLNSVSRKTIKLKILKVRKCLKIYIFSKKTDCFGQVSFFSGAETDYTAKSLGFTTLVLLKKQDFLETLKFFPEDWVIF